jgi:hypothetical protein
MARRTGDARETQPASNIRRDNHCFSSRRTQTIKNPASSASLRHPDRCQTERKRADHQKSCVICIIASSRSIPNQAQTRRPTKIPCVICVIASSRSIPNQVQTVDRLHRPPASSRRSRKQSEPSAARARHNPLRLAPPRRREVVFLHALTPLVKGGPAHTTIPALLLDSSHSIPRLREPNEHLRVVSRDDESRVGCELLHPVLRSQV